uniref:Uncharacterized protein n=1 Tax=Leersia perrieri TaxID=77586 RepID=A0A0D9X2L0_9ORYZ
MRRRATSSAEVRSRRFSPLKCDEQDETDSITKENHRERRHICRDVQSNAARVKLVVLEPEQIEQMMRLLFDIDVLSGKNRAAASLGGSGGGAKFSTASCRLAGKVVATAAAFVRNGAKVILADVQDDLGRAVATELGHDSTTYTHCDVADESQVAAAVDLATAPSTSCSTTPASRARRRRHHPPWRHSTSLTTTASWR